MHANCSLKKAVILSYLHMYISRSRASGDCTLRNCYMHICRYTSCRMNSIHPALSDLRMIHTYVPTSYIQLTKLNQPTAPPRLLPRTCFSSFYASNNFDLFQPPIAQQHMHTRGGRGYNYSVTSAGLAPGGWGTYIQYGYNMHICSNLSSGVGIVVGPYCPLGWIGIIS